MKFHINTVGIREIKFFLHNENQLWVPNSKNIWGSKHEHISLKKCNAKIGCHRHYELKRIHWKAMDYEKQRCDETGLNSNATHCIHNLVRERMGCYIPIDNMEPNGKPLCHTAEQFETAQTLLQQCMTDDESKVYKVTGCLSACEKVRGININLIIVRMRIPHHDFRTLGATCMMELTETRRRKIQLASFFTH